MNSLIKIFTFFIIFEAIFCAPVKKQLKKEDVFNSLHYKEYLEEVIKELESDKKFAEAIKEAEGRNRTEHISQSLAFVNHNIRNKLDEIKRKEVERLNILENELERRKLQAQGKSVPNSDSNFEKLLSTDKGHLDHNNPHTFEIADLEKLIRKTEEDLKLIDTKQEEEYKRHELKKEHLKNKKLESIKDPKKQEEFKHNLDEIEKRHDNHSKIHHPGNEQQLKEVWEKSDKLDPKEFDPKTFFDIHDVNADGHLDIMEIEALMQNELSKVYEANNTDDDMQERYHEMMRMRREMMQLMDSNHDNLISKEEFIKYSSSLNFKDDSAWKTQEETDKKPYTNQELNEFTDGYDAQGDDDDDEFSDQGDSLKYVPEGGKVSLSSNIAPNNADPSVIKADKSLDEGKKSHAANADSLSAIKAENPQGLKSDNAPGAFQKL